MSKGSGSVRGGAGKSSSVETNISVPASVKEALGKDADKAQAAMLWAKSASTAEKKEISENIFKDPVKAIILGQTSPEKADVINFLREKGKTIGENNYQTGVAGTYKLGNQYVSVNGTTITTGQKAVKSRASRAGVSGHQRWYGGGTTIQNTDKSETFSVFDTTKVAALKKKYSK